MKIRTLEQLDDELCALYDDYRYGMTKKEHKKVELKIERFRNQKRVAVKDMIKLIDKVANKLKKKDKLFVQDSVYIIELKEELK